MATTGGSGADGAAALNLKEFLTEKCQAVDEGVGAILKDCYVASGGDVTGVTSDVTWGGTDFGGQAG